MKMTDEEVKQWWKDRYFEGKDTIEIPLGMPTPTLKLQQQWFEEWEKEKKDGDNG